MASLGKRQEEEKSSLKRGVVADGDSLHLREVRESDAGTYVLRSEFLTQKPFIDNLDLFDCHRLHLNDCQSGE